MSLKEKSIFENVLLVVVKIKSGTMKVVNMEFPKKKGFGFGLILSNFDSILKEVLKTG